MLHQKEKAKINWLANDESFDNAPLGMVDTKDK